MKDVVYSFKKGDFITNKNKPGSFAIFEGIEAESYTTVKKYSVIACYDPSKYKQLSNGRYACVPYLDVATRTERCEQTVDGDTSSYWWRLCSDKEKKMAIKLLEDYGFGWDAESKSIVKKDTGEIVRTIIEPKIEYNGQIVKPISRRLKELLRKVCNDITKKKYAYSYSHNDYYNEFWGYDCWD